MALKRERIVLEKYLILTIRQNWKFNFKHDMAAKYYAAFTYLQGKITRLTQGIVSNFLKSALTAHVIHWRRQQKIKRLSSYNTGDTTACYK